MTNQLESTQLPEELQDPRIFTMDLQVRWSDQDMLGHVNNATILTYMEESRIRAMSELRRENSGGAMVTRAMNLEFLAPLMYPAPIIGAVWVSKLGNSSLTLHQELWQNGRVAATMDVVMVAFDTKTQSKASFSDELREILTERLIPEEQGE